MDTPPQPAAYWRPRPASQLNDEARAAFNRLLEAALSSGPAQPMDYDLGRAQDVGAVLTAAQARLAARGTVLTLL